MYTRTLKKKVFFSGLTIIEIVMVITIIGILSALAMPRFSGFYLIKLNGAVKKVVEDIRYVQQRAIAEHTNCRIIFNWAAETYTAEKESPQGSGTWVALKNPFDLANLSIDFDTYIPYNGINLSSANFGGTSGTTSTLRFDWEGTPQNASGTNLAADGSAVLTYKNQTLTIYVTPTTGRVRVQ